MRTTKDTFATLRQGQRFVRHIKTSLRCVPFRVTIERDSYDFQSFCNVHRWDGQQWQHVFSIPYSEWTGTVQTHSDRSAYETLAKRALNEAAASIGDKA